MIFQGLCINLLFQLYFFINRLQKKTQSSQTQSQRNKNKNEIIMWMNDDESILKYEKLRDRRVVVCSLDSETNG